MRTRSSVTKISGSYDISGKGAWNKSDAGTGGASSSSVTQPRIVREYEVSTDEASTRWNRRESSRHAGSSVVPMTTGIVDSSGTRAQRADSNTVVEAGEDKEL